MAKLAGFRKALASYLTEPVVRLLVRTPVTPNIITWLGFLLAMGAAALITAGHLVAAGLVVLVAGFLDIVDGALARHTKRTTRFGAVLDSTLDRLSEGVLLLGILGLFLLTDEQPVLFTHLAREWSVLFIFVTLLGSVLVSYIRARAETLGVDCQVGLFTRGERVVVLVLGLWLNQIIIALAIIAVLSFITAGQRLLYVWQQTKIK
jgi:CDP-diacylglycerol--glycerol-3-phosphate 3-phosphatidyltransferase